MTEPTPDCPRCGRPAAVEWCDIVTGGGQVVRRVPTRTWCETPGCVDDNDSTAVPWPSAPGSLASDDQAWIAEQMRLTQ